MARRKRVGKKSSHKTKIMPAHHLGKTLKKRGGKKGGRKRHGKK